VSVAIVFSTAAGAERADDEVWVLLVFFANAKLALIAPGLSSEI